MKTVIDLFSGIGGFALGLESTGYFKTIQFVENEKWCQKILNKNFPGVPIHEDIKTYKGYDADVVVGGFPCQPFSVAGKQKATQDDRHLWPHMFRVIKETKPTWVIGENVRNIISISEGMVLEQVYLDLESEGYEVQSFIIPASAVNAPHQRYRTWILGYSQHNGSSASEIRCSFDKTSNNNEKRQEKTKQPKRTSRQKNDDDVAHTDHGNHNEKKEIRTRGNTINFSSADVAHSDSRLRRGGGTIRQSRENGQRRFYTTQEKQTTHDLRSKTIRCNTIRGKTENLTGNWNTEPNVGRVAHGIPNRVDRLRGLGNAIVPQIAYQIGKAIMEAEIDY